MPLIYITGPSGAGKSTITMELNERGYEAHDADVSLCTWRNNETGVEVEYPRDEHSRPIDWQKHHSFLMSEKALDGLRQKSHNRCIFVCGIAPNDLDIANNYFDKIICLFIDEETMLTRVLNRKNNKYGQSPDQLEVIKKWYQPTIDKYRNYGAVMVDASAPVANVVDDIILKVT